MNDTTYFKYFSPMFTRQLSSKESNEAQTNLHKGQAALITTISIPYIKDTINKIRWCLFRWIIFMLHSGVEWPWDASSCKLDHNDPCKTTEYHATVDLIRSTLETGRPLMTRLKEHQKHCKYGETDITNWQVGGGVEGEGGLNFIWHATKHMPKMFWYQ